MSSRFSPRSAWLAVMPGLFVVLWSSGFVGAKLGLPHAGPFTFVSLRCLVAAALMLVLSQVMRQPWPATRREALHIAVAGSLIQGVYLGGVYVGIWLGVGPGLTALIVSLQPVLTAALVRGLLGERVRALQWLGLALGLLGVALVVSSKLDLDRQHLEGAGVAVLALLGITFGTLYQKRFCSTMNLCTGTVIQNAVAGFILLVPALALEGFLIDWAPIFVAVLAWFCLVMAPGATLLLFVLLRRGAASRITSLFYLVPPVTAVMAYLAFGETLNAAAMVGMGFAAVGVALAVRG